VGSRVTPAVVPDGDEHHLRGVEAAYRAHGARCYAIARQIVRDPQLAQDVVQEVFASLVKERGRFDPERGTLATWLMTLTHHKSVDLIRSRERRVGLDAADSGLALMPELSAGPEDAAEISEQGALVRGALHRLSSIEREVIVLGYFGGYSQSQIARRLGVPLGTVKSRTSHGLRHLAEHLELPAA
jgi:RNA polymerase sigma factor (sigma-70 family)